MKHKLDGILIVEGKDDQAYLSNFIDTYFYVTNGYNLYDEDIAFLNKASQFNKVYILTDPDEAGILIRKRLNEKIQNLINIYVDIIKCNRNGKHGVAECEKDEIILKLSPYFRGFSENIPEISSNDLYSLNISNDESRARVAKRFALGRITNSKQLLQRLNILKISKDDINKFIKETNNENN